jgi:hypothetical protein
MIRSALRRDKCLDLDTTTAFTNDAKVHLWQCNNHQAQQWTVVAGEYQGFLRLINDLSGKCLDGDNNTIGSNGTKVHGVGCNTSRNQAWNRTIKR